MDVYSLPERARYQKDRPYLDIVHDHHAFRILVFNFEPGQELPVHQHPAESEVAIMVLKGEGVFTGAEEEIQARPGSLLICKVSEPHGVRATTRMQVLVTIAPPF
jgi:quercetin dioxygenase-like cupin family protein